MHLLTHQTSTDTLPACITSWHINDLLIEATWHAPFTLNSVKIRSYGCNNSTHNLLPTDQARALSKDSTDVLMSWLVCETLCTTLDLDDPLLLDIMMARMQARGRLLDAVTVFDNRSHNDCSGNGNSGDQKEGITDDSDASGYLYDAEPKTHVSLSAAFSL